jgi:hypothetical protein
MQCFICKQNECNFICMLYLKNLTLALDYSFSHLKILCVLSLHVHSCVTIFEIKGKTKYTTRQKSNRKIVKT